MRLLLIRHGQTPANVRGILETTVPGPGLTDLGREQAAALPDALADRGITRIFVSNMVRTSETAAPLAAALGLRPVVLPGLREIESGDLEGARDRVSVDSYLSTFFAWIQGDREQAIPGSSNGHEFFARYDDAIAQVVATGASVAAVFSHGAAIRTWAGATWAHTDETFSGHALSNTGIVELDGVPGSWRVVEWEGVPLGGAELLDPAAPDPTGRL